MRYALRGVLFALVPVLCAADEREEALTRKMAQDFERRTHLIKDAVVAEEVNRIARELTSRLPDDSRAYRFTVFDDDPAVTRAAGMEPCWFPPDAGYLPASVIAAARDEAEVAGVMAHAVAHLLEGHGAKPLKVVRSASIPLLMYGGWGCGTLVPRELRKEIAANELAADRMAVKLMAGAGYDPAALLRFVDREQDADATAARGATPGREARAAALRAEIAALEPGRPWVLSRSGFARLQAQVRAATGRAVPSKPPTLRRPAR